MFITGWVLSKVDTLDDGTQRPVVSAMSMTWHAPQAPSTPDGWCLVCITCDGAHLRFMRAHPALFIWCGNEFDFVPPELLTLCAGKLDPARTYSLMGQVISRLGETEQRYLNFKGSGN